MPRPRPDETVLAAIPAKRPGITKRGIERKLGMKRQTVWRTVKRLHDGGRCHVCGWLALKSGAPFQPRYAAGPGIDVECTLVPQSAEVSQRRFREKARATGAWDVRAAKLRAIYRRKKMKKTLWYAALQAPADGVKIREL